MPDNEGKLYVVPTPIGNLSDLTLRAIEVLKNVSLIYAEDTRTSGLLLRKYEISTPLRSYHAFNEHKQLDHIIDIVRSGQNIALVSDAGTPGISDPGYLLIHRLRNEGIAVSCLPGPTAFVPALVMSGLPSDKFYFEGFLPHKKGRQSRLKEIALLPCTVILYESPYRLAKCIEELIAFAGEDRTGCIVREVSKIHEQSVTGSLKTLLEQINDGHIPPRGEIVILLQGKTPEKKQKNNKPDRPERP